MKTRRNEDMETWGHGDMETWRHGDMETWRHGVMETWRQGEMKKWRHGDMETWRHGDMKTWRHKRKTLKTKNRSPGDFHWSVYQLLLVQKEVCHFVCFQRNKRKLSVCKRTKRTKQACPSMPTQELGLVGILKGVIRGTHWACTYSPSMGHSSVNIPSS